VLGLGKGVSVALAGWLWADILLGLFVTYLAANSVGAPPQDVRPSADAGIDPRPIEIVLKVDGDALLAGTADAIAREQARIVSEVRTALETAREQRKVAMVLAYGTHASPAEGDRLGRLAVDPLAARLFGGAAFKTFHELVPGDRGSTVTLEVFVHQR
jgi:hypothetical protein